MMDINNRCNSYTSSLNILFNNKLIIFSSFAISFSFLALVNDFIYFSPDLAKNQIRYLISKKPI